MKKHNYITIALLLFSCISIASYAQDAKNDLLLSLSYFNNNNQTQYLTAHTKTKIEGKFQLVAGIQLSFYIGSEAPANLLGKSITNDKGEATVLIPAAAKEEWNKTSKPGFIVVSEASKLYDANKANTDIVKAKIKIDTAADKKIVATLLELKDTVWAPVKGVDIKIAVKRFDGDLNVSETQTYTTDSTGMASADFKRDTLAGDSKGNLVLIAKVEDNDIYGNLSSEKIVPWGVATNFISQYDRRTLFARRGHSPIWLEMLAYSIIVGVWGVLIYLIVQIKKLKSLGV